MNAETAKERTEQRLNETVGDNATLQSAILRVYSDAHDLDWRFASGEIDGAPAQPSQPYHAASVGKTFTSTIIAMLVEEGKLRFDDPITPYLSNDLLDGLHVYRGTDYTEDIRIHHLLSHTSGLPHLLSDGFGLFTRRKEESPEGKTFLDVMLDDSDRFFEPEETIEWAMEKLHPHFPPGDGIFYSEVGYNLLGLIIEAVTLKSYDESLHDFLFKPLSMDHSYLAQFSEPAEQSPHPVPPMQFEDQAFDVEEYRSFSGWYAGGQTVNTAEDLLAFHRALVEGELVSEGTLDEMRQWRRLSLMGIHYGYGIVQFRPIPLISKYRMWGGIGVTNAFTFYSPGYDVYLVGTFNQTTPKSKGYKFAFQALRTISKIDS